MDGIKESHETYGEIVKCWAEEREILGIVQPYTAQKAEQKASLFYPWLENKALEEIGLCRKSWCKPSCRGAAVGSPSGRQFGMAGGWALRRNRGI